LTISPPITALAVGLPAQRAIAQRFCALALRVDIGMSAFPPLVEAERTSLSDCRTVAIL
jgi:hypothetical protein